MTPNCSPPSHPTTPVIVTNPNFLPPPPLLPRHSPYQPSPLLPPQFPIGSRLPPPSCRWDSATNTPSYHKSNQEFWSSRQLPIPIRSTISSVISGLGFTPDSNHSSDAFEQAEVCDIEEEVSVLGARDIPLLGAEMSSPSDPAAAAEATRLSDIRDEVEYLISRLRPDKITTGHIVLAKQKLSDILTLSNKFGVGINALLKKNPTMEQSFRLQYKADLDSLEQAVDDIEDKVCDKIHQLQLNDASVAQSAALNVEPPAASVGAGALSQIDAQHAQTASVAMAKAATIAKAVVKYNTLLDLSLNTTQDMETDGLYLDTATNERIQKLVMKISKYEKTRDKIKASHVEYLELNSSS